MKKVRQKLRKFQESLGIFYLPALLGVTFLFLLILGWSNVQPTSYSFELNQVAKETVRAPKSVEDKEQTEKNQQMAMDGVGDIYVFDQNREQQQIDKVNSFSKRLRQSQQKLQVKFLQLILQRRLLVKYQQKLQRFKIDLLISRRV